MFRVGDKVILEVDSKMTSKHGVVCGFKDMPGLFVSENDLAALNPDAEPGNSTIDKMIRWMVKNHVKQGLILSSIDRVNIQDIIVSCGMPLDDFYIKSALETYLLTPMELTTFNIQFQVDGRIDETSFDVESLYELGDCWLEFAKENRISPSSIVSYYPDEKETLKARELKKEEAIVSAHDKSSANNPSRVRIPLGNNKFLTAEIGTNPDFKEIFIGLEKDGTWFQDLAIVGEEYRIDKMDVIPISGKYSVKVYADGNNEDFTNEYVVDEYSGE